MLLQKRRLIPESFSAPALDQEDLDTVLVSFYLYLTPTASVSTGTPASISLTEDWESQAETRAKEAFGKKADAEFRKQARGRHLKHVGIVGMPDWSDKGHL